MRLIPLAAVVTLSLALPAAAQTTQMSPSAMSGMDHSAMPMAGDTPATLAFKAGNATMHQNMAIQYSGDADVDFAKAMIAHHQGAIDMAKVELRYGKDRELTKLANDIIAAQEHEIAQMRAWLAKHGG